MISKKRLHMAYEGFYNEDNNKALKYYDDGKQLAEIYPVKGEADMELMIMEWIKEKSEEVLAAFMLPPLQVVASGINFLTLLITSKHLFELPFKTIEDIKKSTVLIESLSVKNNKLKNA